MVRALFRLSQPIADEAAFRTLNAAIRAMIETLPGANAGLASTECAHLLAHTKASRFVPPVSPARHAAVERHMPAILAPPFTGVLGPVKAALAATWDRLGWHYHYDERADSPGLGQRVAFAELIGPKAPLVAGDIRLGFTFMAPGVLYPAHAHPAHELYIVLSGRAQWSVGTQAAWRDPGAVIVHPSEAPHAMRTADAPLLALYSWRGAIDAPARYV